MAIRVREMPTEAHPFAPQGSIVIGVKCDHMPKPFLDAFPGPQTMEAVQASLAALGAPPDEPMNKMAMARQAVIGAIQHGLFANCKCDERFWMKHGEIHEIHVDEPGTVPHSHCQFNGHAFERN